MQRQRQSPQKTKIDINIPAGIDNRQAVNARGMGDSGMNGGPSGDLRVVVNVKPSKDFERDGYDLWYEKHVSIVEATLGAELRVPTLDGDVKYTMPAGTQPHEVFKLRGKGIQRIGSTGKGDLFVRVIVDIPKNVSAEQRNCLNNLTKPIQAPEKAAKKAFLTNSRKINALLQNKTDSYQ